MYPSEFLYNKKNNNNILICILNICTSKLKGKVPSGTGVTPQGRKSFAALKLFNKSSNCFFFIFYYPNSN